MLLDIVTADTTDYSCILRIVDSADGTPETGAAHDTAGIDLWYRRPGGAHTSITEATQTEGGAHSDGGFVHISDGYYRLDLPDAAVASGVDYVDVGGTITGMVVIGGRIRIASATRGLAGTALPDAAADAAGGLIISDAGGLDIDATDANVTLALADTNELQTDWANGGRLDLIVDAILADTGTDGVALSSSTIGAIADQIWDESAAGHVAAGSFGAANQVFTSGTAQAGTGTTIQFAASGPSAVDDFYNNCYVVILSGTGAGQARFITDYVGSTKTATVDTWVTNPSTDSVYAVLPFSTLPGSSAPTASQVADAVWDELMADHTTSGSAGEALGGSILRTATAQAGGASSITLDASASATNDLYNYSVIRIISGTGAGQSRQISDYNGTSKVATVSLAWTTQPSSDSVFQIIALGVDAATVASIADGVWDEARAEHVTAGTFGERVNANLTQVSGDTTAADNLEAMLDGTGGVTLTTGITGNITGNLSGSVGSVTGAVGSVTGAVGSVTGNVGGNVVGSVASVTGAVGSVTGNVGGNVVGSVGSLATQAKADVNAEVVDVLTVDAVTQPGQGAPAANAAVATMLAYLYKGWRNRVTQTASQYSLYNDDATTVDQKATVSDDGTTFSKGEVATGP